MLERLRTAWCRQFHNSISWPVHGYYTCNTCHRAIRVPWDEPGSVTNRVESGANSIENIFHGIAALLSKPIPHRQVVYAAVSRVERRLRHR